MLAKAKNAKIASNAVAQHYSKNNEKRTLLLMQASCRCRFTSVSSALSRSNICGGCMRSACQVIHYQA
jgi:hypothetical protein